MDINVLYALQEFRNGTGGILASFFSKMTWLGELSSDCLFIILSA
jgi:hypothetical protein